MHDQMGTPPWVDCQTKVPLLLCQLTSPLSPSNDWRGRFCALGSQKLSTFLYLSVSSSQNSSQNCSVSTGTGDFCSSGGAYPAQGGLRLGWTGAQDLLWLFQSAKPIAPALWLFFIISSSCFFWTLLFVIRFYLLVFSSPLISILQVQANLFFLASSLPAHIPTPFLFWFLKHEDLFRARDLCPSLFGFWLKHLSGSLWPHRCGWCSFELFWHKNSWISFPTVGILTFTFPVLAYTVPRPLLTEFPGGIETLLAVAGFSQPLSG